MLISILASLLIFCLIAGLVWYLVGLFPLPAPFKTAVQAILVVIGILYLIGLLFGLQGLPVVRL